MPPRRPLRSSLSLFIFALAAAAGPAACADTSAEEDAERDESAVISGDALARAKIVEKSRFRHAGRATAEQDGTNLLAYRFNGFGGTKVKIKVTARDAAFTPTVVLAGPIPGEETKVVLQKRGTRQGGVAVEATLQARGAYRLLIGTQSAFSGRRGEAGAFDVDFACLAGCDLPEITLAEVLRDLEARVGEDTVQAGIEQLLAAHVADPELRTKITTQLVALLATSANPDAAAPVIPMGLLGVGQGLFEHAPSPSATRAPAEPPRPIDVELSELGKECRVTRATPQQISPSLPGLSIAEAPDYAYDDCQLARLEGLASALNALSLEDGSVVRDGDARYATIADLVTALVRQGHHVVMDNARYYADFLGLDYNGATVRAPVWMDTGIALPAGGTLKIPAPHAHHNLYVTGPRFDGQLKFYMGVDGGTSFRVQSNIPRRWSGGKIEYTVDGATSPDDVLLLLTTAGKLRKKWQGAGASLPMQGYGRLGVCTDSTAVLEKRLRGTVTLFPLAHPRSEARADEIDQAFAAIPSDLAGFDREDALRRIGASIPFANVDDVPFPAFKTAWAALGR